MEHRGLGRSACATVCLGGVLAVLDDIEIETSKIHYTEVVHPLVDLVEFVSIVCRDDLLLEFACPL